MHFRLYVASPVVSAPSSPARAKIGSGSTADAVRAEQETGENVGGKFHREKAENYVRSLSKWLNTHADALPTDKMAAQNVLRDLLNALKGN